jgi:hypothetical protein
MPDEAREVVFPKPVPIRLLRERDTRAAQRGATPPEAFAPSADPESAAAGASRRAHAPAAGPARGVPAAASTDATLDRGEDSTQAEGELTSEAPEIERQARRARRPEGTTNLLET